MPVDCKGHFLSRVDQLIRTLELAPHPEGGFYREIWRSHGRVEPVDARGGRAALTSIYFLLPTGAISRWHRVRSDEIWHHYEGAPLELLLIPANEHRIERAHLGPLAEGQQPVHGVAAGSWQAARSLGAYTLVGCAVAPGFEFADFELLSDRPELATQICEALPEAAEFK
ncbi:MAG TPA: cupin domain-containing protein [Candidatus Polarisedimenticolaceae bacterium]|nr:cupin domain-containing protein [Candidatus Polarisedimenticolaceae bacterium]